MSNLKPASGLQVLTALQRVLGSVKMQQQQQQQQQYDHMRSTSLPHLRQASVGISGSGVGPAAFVDAEREQRIAQQQLDWQRKEAAYQAELSLAQTSNAKLHEQVRVSSSSGSVVAA